MEDTPAENAPNVAGDVLRGARRIAQFLSEELGEEVTEDMVFYWTSSGKLRYRKWGHNISTTKTEAREDVRGTVVA